VAPALSSLFRDSAAIRNHLIKSRTEYFELNFGLGLVLIVLQYGISLGNKRQHLSPNVAGDPKATNGRLIEDVGPD
jgi:hypothetical protein